MQRVTFHTPEARKTIELFVDTVHQQGALTRHHLASKANSVAATSTHPSNDITSNQKSNRW
jgi:hypothetical protein